MDETCPRVGGAQDRKKKICQNVVCQEDTRIGDGASEGPRGDPPEEEATSSEEALLPKGRAILFEFLLKYRYPMRHEGPPLPPPQPMGPPRGYAPRQEVVFFDHPAPPPSAHQASPVVYFDPAVQQPNRPLPPREKKIIEIKSPN